MKRNGAGLASICILSTMVLVMVSSTVCLYIGAEDSLVRAYLRRSIVFRARMGGLGAQEAEAAQTVRGFALAQAEQSGQTASNLLDYRLAEGSVYFRGSEADLAGTVPYDSASTLWELRIVPLEDYNRVMGQNVALAPNQALLYTTQVADYGQDVVALQSGVTLTIADRVDSFLPDGRRRGQRFARDVPVRAELRGGRLPAAPPHQPRGQLPDGHELVLRL